MQIEAENKFVLSKMKANKLKETDLIKNAIKSKFNNMFAGLHNMDIDEESEEDLFSGPTNTVFSPPVSQSNGKFP